MKKKYLIGLSALFFSLALSNCEYKKKAAELCDEKTKNITYENKIKSIVNTNCAYSGCHVSGGIPPNLSDLEKVQKASLKIKQEINDGTMPPKFSNKTLSSQERTEILCWIENGML